MRSAADRQSFSTVVPAIGLSSATPTRVWRRPPSTQQLRNVRREVAAPNTGSMLRRDALAVGNRRKIATSQEIPLIKTI